VCFQRVAVPGERGGVTVTYIVVDIAVLVVTEVAVLKCIAVCLKGDSILWGGYG